MRLEITKPICNLTRLVSLHDVVEGELAHAEDLQAQVAHADREGKRGKSNINNVQGVPQFMRIVLPLLFFPRMNLS